MLRSAHLGLVTALQIPVDPGAQSDGGGVGLIPRHPERVYRPNVIAIGERDPFKAERATEHIVWVSPGGCGGKKWPLAGWQGLARWQGVARWPGVARRGRVGTVSGFGTVSEVSTVAGFSTARKA